ncbi:MAG: phosphoglycerate mutase family protein [Acidobacteria bacterium]|nr:phosphoglycerate mutase family protein [Acidobacteriota bacterium]
MESEVVMKIFRVLTAVLLSWLCVAASVAEAQMVILVRHAERADAGAAAGAAMTGTPDPELSEAGKARAQALVAMLKGAGITAIYTTEFRRTIDTALPLSDALNVVSTTVPAREQASLIEKLKAHTGGAVLVVGHSNTVPAIIKALGGPAFTIAENEYDNIFFVAPGGVTTRIRFTP